MRASSSPIFRSSGPIPSIGEIAPCRTWYIPLYDPERSIDRMSSGSSTTQMTERSRESLLQTRQGSISVTFWQVEQRVTRSFTSRIAWASECASAAGMRRR